MQSRMNLKIKFRESFRPFAPAVLAEQAPAWFGLDRESPYMLLVAPVRPGAGTALPAVTHVDGSARVQTVSAARHPRLHRLLQAFERRTGCPVLVNTSFNVRGQPIVCDPEDAYRCFMATGMDHLVMGGRLLNKAEQPPLREPPGEAGPLRPGLAGALRTALAPLGRAWMKLADALAWLNGRVLFGAVWLALVVPYALAHRLLGKPTLALRFDPGAATYRSPAPPDAPGHLERPY